MIKHCLVKIRAHLIGFSCALFLISCNLDEFPNLDNLYYPNYEGNIALSLINDTISFQEFLEDNISESSAYIIDEEQRVIFSYDISTDFSLTDNFVQIDDFSNQKTINSPVGIPFIAPFDTTITFKKQLIFNFPAADDEPLDSLYFKGGIFKFLIESTFPTPINYQFTTAAFKEIASNDSIVIASTIDPAISPYDSSKMDLNGYKINLVTETDSNKFVVNLIADIVMQAGDQLLGNEVLDINVNVIDSDFEVIFGSFGQDTFEVDQKRKKLKFFDDIGGTGIEFESPKVTFSIDNGFGIPIGVDFSEVYVTYSDGNPEKLTGSFADQLQIVNAPTTENVGSIVTTTLELNESNSNLRELLAGSPSEFVLTPIGYTNPETIVPNWLSDESTIAIDAKVSIPFSIRVDGLELEETTDLDDLSSLEGTQSITLVIYTLNELPFDGSLNLYMEDENEVAIDSLIGNVLFAAPQAYDSNGKVSSPAENTTKIELFEDKINSLIAASRLRMLIKLNSYGASKEEFVEIFADYDLQVKLGVSGKVSIDLNDN